MSGDCVLFSATNLGDLAPSIGELLGDFADSDLSGDAFLDDGLDEFMLSAPDLNLVSAGPTPSRLRNNLDFFFAASSGLSSRSHISVSAT